MFFDVVMFEGVVIIFEGNLMLFDCVMCGEVVKIMVRLCKVLGFEKDLNIINNIEC